MKKIRRKRGLLMKKLLSLMLVLCLLPMFSLAEHSIAANYIYQ